MALVSAISNFFSRHRRKLLVSAGAMAAGYFAVEYLKNKLFEIQDRLATERSAKENLRRRFDQNQEDATYTIMALLPALTLDIIDAYPVESLTQELQAKRVTPNTTTTTDTTTTNTNTNTNTKSKTRLWNELKQAALARLFTLIYAVALLTFLTRLQLNILGRRNYVRSVMELAEQRRGTEITMVDSTSTTSEEKMFLSLSWWFVNKGWVSLSQQVDEAVRQVFGGINPRTELTLDQFSELVGRVQYTLDFAEDGPRLLESLLPPEELEGYVIGEALGKDEEEEECPALGALIDEARDYIESPQAMEVVKRLVHGGLRVVVGKVGAGLYEGRAETKLASVLANVARQAQGLSGGNPLSPNEYVCAMAGVAELNSFSAIVYGNFGE